ncbi:MAG: NUDIX hydrolase N-terminal domain-containing protein [Candidatus Binataceae bacterium]
MDEDRLLLELARFIERVTAIARTGLAFKPHVYDAERYEELINETARMTATAMEAGPDAAEAIRRGWRDAVIAGYDGYVTPAVGCGIIAFNQSDEVLMIQRPTAKWWYPAGFCEVGVSPAENIVKEALEETGLFVRPARLMALTDTRKAGEVWRHIYSLLFYCEILGGELRRHPDGSAGPWLLPARCAPATAARQRSQMDRDRARVSFQRARRTFLRSDLIL